MYKTMSRLHVVLSTISVGSPRVVRHQMSSSKY